MKHSTPNLSPATPSSVAPRSSTTPSLADDSPRTPKLSRDRVRGGRVKKSARNASISSLPTTEQLQREVVGKLDDKERELELRRFEEMQEEKRFFPRADEWHPDEARLFEVLYMRQYQPLIPSFWDIDFRGIPIPDILFQTSAIDQPVVYSASGQDYKATKALISMIELTGNVRFYVQTHQSGKVSSLLKKSLDSYVDWAALDGGYSHLDIIPNILVTLVDLTMSGDEITEWMKDQMEDLAKRHRDHLRVEDDAATAAATRSRAEENDEGKEEVVQSIEGRYKNTFHNGDDEDGGAGRGPPTRPAVKYSRRPPVIYGLFIIKTTVMVLTADAAKEGDDFHTSYQVELGFSVKGQGVWNAMTTAIVVCLARDDMIGRKQDFEPRPLEPDSDPDM